MNLISLYHLKYFKDAATLKSVAQAAKANHVSPSAISQAIKNLESEFDVILLEHSKNRFNLTEHGKQLLDNSHDLLESAQKLMDNMAMSSGEGHVEAKFATQQSIAQHLLPPFLSQMQKKHPQIKPNLRLGTVSMVRQWLSQRSIDFALTLEEDGFEEYESVSILKGEFVFIESKLHKNIPRGFLITGETQHTRQFKKVFEYVHGVKPDILMEVDSWGVIKRFVEEGLGIGFVPDYVLRYDAKHTLRRVPIGTPKIGYEIRAFYHGSRRRLGHGVKTFLSELDYFTS
jgi:DNA-binding transcriptional LysR family regulator